jgi:hypothetical protein
MRSAAYSRCVVAVSLAALFALAASPARADVIVLKNGRQIVASNVTRENGKIRGETPEGEISLPDSMVDRIEKDGTAAAPRVTKDLGIGPPADNGFGNDQDVVATVIHDGAIDREALARIDGAANGENPAATRRAAVAESVAGGFEMGRGSVADALSHAQRALLFEPEEPSLLLNVAYLHLLRQENDAALDYLDRARRVAPNSADVAKLAGWAEYGLNRIAQAIAEWKRAQALRPDPEVARALENAERDAQAESNFREGESAHFSLRYDGGAAPQLPRQVLDALESDFDEIASQLNYTPPEPIGVVLYANQEFADITRAPSWVGALNDGRIRIPVQGLTSVTPELAHVLKHELAHSFIGQKTHGRAPVWLQEGVAQWIEGRRCGSVAANLLALYDQHEDPALSTLEGSWMSLPKDYAGVAYAWSLAVVETIVDEGGASDIERLLDRVGSEPNTEAAAKSALHEDYAELNKLTADYLRRTYLSSAR